MIDISKFKSKNKVTCACSWTQLEFCTPLDDLKFIMEREESEAEEILISSWTIGVLINTEQFKKEFGDLNGMYTDKILDRLNAYYENLKIKGEIKRTMLINVEFDDKLPNKAMLLTETQFLQVAANR